MEGHIMALSEADHPLLVEDESMESGVVRVLTLNRPSKRNAIDTNLFRHLYTQLLAANSDSAVRAVVLAGTGPHFCGGGDLKEFLGLPDARDRMIARAHLLASVQQLMPTMSIPVVAAVQGAALGAGAALALGVDVTVAGSDLAIGYPELMDGVVPALVMTQPVHQLSRKIAFEMITAGRRLGAGEAERHGLINRVVGPAQVRASALETAKLWADVDRRTLARAKKLFYRLVELPHTAAIDTGLDTTAATWQPWQSQRQLNEIST
ncbi:enoyl-CoA hydratase/isomerase family protein [Rhodococcus sp. NPDC056743]|uniref:enoyl-CoA hydratase/isomerase family protein n=1 Tax=Rhodococcus sp. NPDC056743 TaxID=3345934 RepID=UPI00366FB552